MKSFSIKIALLLALSLASFTLFSQDNWKHGRLRVTDSRHYLQFEDGTPFFWLGDTGWELFHRLKKEEIEKYLENRRKKGFNLIQAAILADLDGLRKPNQYGDLPLKDMDPEKPNEPYFKLVDWVLQKALSKNMFVGLLPTWGDKVYKAWGIGPVIFNEKNAYTYGLYLGKRYAALPNIVWILGGDRPAMRDTNDWRPVWRAMAKGIKEGTNNKAILTYHTWGGKLSTSQQIHDEDWLDINMMQSGHGDGHDVPVWEWIERDRQLQPTKPTLDSEPNYEDHPVNPSPDWDSTNGYFRDYDVRKQIYRSVFAGGCGVTYGHHSVWQFYSKREKKLNHADRYWTAALDRPGAFQAGYLHQLINARPSLNRIPAQEIIKKGQRTKGDYITAFRNEDDSCAMIYLPVGKEVGIGTNWLKSAKISAWWFNPRSGMVTNIGKIKRQETMLFTPPTIGIENDWVLVIENSVKPVPVSIVTK